MREEWNQARIQQYIDNGIEESTYLDYKEARALGKSKGRKKEIAKDVSAMANTAGGIIIYGVSENGHVPERITPIDRNEYPKEWLDQVITHNVRPLIEGLTIHSVSIDTAPNHVVYVVEIPPSTTAHQVTAEKDYRYYERLNFASERMEDYRIRDVMNRAIIPNADVEFGLHLPDDEYGRDDCLPLMVLVKNQGDQVINRFKIILTFPYAEWNLDDNTGNIRVEDLEEIEVDDDKNVKYAFRHSDEEPYIEIVYQSNEVLFPKEEVDIGRKIRYGYPISWDKYGDPSWESWNDFARDMGWSIEWTLYADNMPRKQGVAQVHKLA